MDINWDVDNDNRNFNSSLERIKNMYLLILRKKGSYQDIRFVFNDFEECCIFMNNAMHAADEDIEMTICKGEGEEDETV